MTDVLERPSLVLTKADIEPVVCQIFDKPAVEILSWQMTSLAGGAAVHAGFGLGTYRLNGTARVDGQEQAWSAVMKATGPSSNPELNRPTHTEYWKREVLIFQTGLLEQLPGPLVVPRCYGVQELPHEEYRIWMEEIQPLKHTWTLYDHQRAAHHLGEFNGAYLMGHPLPAQPSWMLSGRTAPWLELWPPDREELLALTTTPLVGQWLSAASVERMLKLWHLRHALLEKLARLPQCFCHHDAFQRNLMLRLNGGDAIETVAIDWAHAGPGRVGQEIAITLAVNLYFMEVAASQAEALDHALFAGYCDGLRAAGWVGDPRLVRFGYTATVALTIAVAFTTIIARMMNTDGGRRGVAFLGHTVDERVAHMRIAHPYLLDLGDEAVGLMQHI